MSGGSNTLRIMDVLAFVGMEFFDSGFGEEQNLFAGAFADVQE
jgi:hypothetical protein